VKSAVFHPKARDAIRKFPEDVRRELGKVIFDLQKGEKTLDAFVATDGFGCIRRRGIARKGPFRRVSSFLLYEAG